jgi:hypothetical protein
LKGEASILPSGIHRATISSMPLAPEPETIGVPGSVRFLQEKAAWYLARGVKIVWLVLPATREVVVVTAGGMTRYGEGDALPTHPELPGLAPDVYRFFRQLD